MQRVLIGLIRFYQRYISIHLPRSCLYHPSCSEYTVEMIRRHGVFRGLVGGILRVFRCQGWLFIGGNDPVPRFFSWRRILSRYPFFWKGRRKR
ncbi:MAG: membrane protein insertion efficiency factor YidD [Brevinematales bacterium]|nr:membrane protein insertion efficiency factor YidD [Brevinematales bacterium]